LIISRPTKNRVKHFCAKDGWDFDFKKRGCAYPSKLEKPVEEMRDGQLLKFNDSGEVVAYIFVGSGAYKEDDLDKPTFLCHMMVDKVNFKRLSDEVNEVLRIKY
jgi:hypothetical protein